MGNWSKPKPPPGSVYVVMPIGERYGVGLRLADSTVTRVKSRALRLNKQDTQAAVDRMNERITVVKIQVVQIEQESRWKS